jgi:hypothetical protein
MKREGEDLFILDDSAAVNTKWARNSFVGFKNSLYNGPAI